MSHDLQFCIDRRWVDPVVPHPFEVIDPSNEDAGNVLINDPARDAGIPFGGYKQSGNGREYAEYGLEDFLETKGILGYEAA